VHFVGLYYTIKLTCFQVLNISISYWDDRC